MFASAPDGWGVGYGPPTRGRPPGHDERRIPMLTILLIILLLLILFGGFGYSRRGRRL